MRLQTTIILLISSVFILALFVTDMLISNIMADIISTNKQEKVSYVAKMMANSTLVIESLSGERGEGEIQEFANRIRKATDVDYIVVMNMNGIRKSHPNPLRVGQLFVGGDEKRALQGEEYVSTAEGTLGLSLRAFTPIFRSDGEQLGVVAVGILLVNVKDEITDNRLTIMGGIATGGMIGVVGAFFLAWRIRKILFGLEPREISRLLKERSAMLESTREGIIAVNRDAKITVANMEAQRLFREAGLDPNYLGKNIDKYLPNSRLSIVLQTGEAEYDQEQMINGNIWVVNRTPIILDGSIVGAISTFRDKSEVNQLAEKLTGVQMYVEALRTQTHEFMNKLHVILGMMELGAYERLIEYIKQITKKHQQEVGTVVRSIRDPVLAGFILGKLSYAREMGTELTLIIDSVLPEPRDPHITHELITIMGNLVDNALQAVQEFGAGTVVIHLNWDGDRNLLVRITDTGPGLTETNREQIFMSGYSTKGDHRGIGLSLVKHSVELLGGRLQVSSQEGKGSTFEVQIPYEGIDQE
ncbi:DcuS/MalK family sensor histidine kinase [Paenibacillus turpanensis]|uniref:DcuS/MalK family sensor histidine kinase n=1 Tax=Paenibacillus turpanensis TaxID=2689078 RepID=UPI001A9FEA2D|nr:DcuS/MalK family sensor histidine kinase [Paenibacillus turpanensis]